ncbi:MAG: T9SS type A sorting domain-containing protein, partial [Bacteroidales bacterium]|nr:T9SS type A sorting domain-containing protein [Bacteroidales bacterium]
QALIFNNKSNDQISISIYNPLGMRIVENEIIEANSVKNIYLSNIANGIYYSHITVRDGSIKIIPFVKY